MSNPHRKALQKLDAQHREAVRRVAQLQLQLRTPVGVTVTELAQLQVGSQVAHELRKLHAAGQRLVHACMPEAIKECERTASDHLRVARTAARHERKAGHHAALIAEVRPVAPVVPVKLAHDHLSEACADSVRRKRTHNTTDCTRRAACVGTSAPAAPPAVVGQRPTAAQLCADQSGVSPPM